MIPLNLGAIQDLVNKYAPVVYLNTSEEYLPASIDWFLPQVSLMDQNGKVVSTAVTEAVLASAAATDYLSINDLASTTPGNLSSAPFYVRFTEVGDSSDQYDIEYWFFYAFNGCSSVGLELEIGSKRPSKTVEIPPFGEHQGDWEHTTVRLDATTLDVVGVFTAQHGGGAWETGNYPVYSGTQRPIVYSAFHSHATYPKIGTESIKTIAIGKHDFEVKIGLRDTTDGGTEWDPLRAGGPGALLASVNVTNVTDSDALWTQFPGHWGPPTDQHAMVAAAAKIIYDTAKDLGMPKSGLMEDEIKKVVVDLSSLILPGGPLNPSQQGAWAKGETTSP